jgi:DNA-directed RNA polymerase specialized sigma24 family protein
MVAINQGWLSLPPPTPQITGPDDQLASDLRWFARTLATMPTGERETLRCRAEGHGLAGCAEVLGVPVNTIKRRHQRMMRRLGLEGSREGRTLRVMYLLGRYDATRD